MCLIVMVSTSLHSVLKSLVSCGIQLVLLLMMMDLCMCVTGSPKEEFIYFDS